MILEPVWSIAMILLGIVGGLLILLKVYIKTSTAIYKGTEKLTGKTVVVTGANSGIGFESVKDFAKRGARLVMVCRDMEKGESAKQIICRETGNKDISVVHADFAVLSSVRKCAETILKSETRIDVLLNNAGSCWEGSRNTEDGLEYLMQTNYFGPFLLTNLLLDRIKQSAPSRIVNVSSQCHNLEKLNTKRLDMANETSEMRIYCNTTFCTVLFTKELAKNLKGSGVTVNSLDPGFVRTAFTKKAPLLMKLGWNIISPIFKTAAEGAQTSIYLCVSPDVENVTGEYFAECKRATMAKRSNDAEMSNMLWILSEEAVKLRRVEVMRKRYNAGG